MYARPRRAHRAGRSPGDVVRMVEKGVKEERWARSRCSCDRRPGLARASSASSGLPRCVGGRAAAAPTRDGPARLKTSDGKREKGLDASATAGLSARPRTGDDSRPMIVDFSRMIAATLQECGDNGGTEKVLRE